MFDQLFRSPAVLRRHRDGPLAQERVAFLTRLAIQGSPTSTLLKCARYGLAIAHVLQARPPDQVFTTSEIDGLARAWAVDRVQHRRAVGPRWALSTVPSGRHRVSHIVGPRDAFTDARTSLRARSRRLCHGTARPLAVCDDVCQSP